MSGTIEGGLIVFLILISALALALRNQKRERKRLFRAKSKKEWGSTEEVTISPAAFREMNLFSKEAMKRMGQKGERDQYHPLDEITIHDIDLNRLFRCMNHTMSSPGADVLYHWLYVPLLSGEKLKDRNRRIMRMSQSESERLVLMEKLFSIGVRKDRSLYGSALRIREATPIDKWKFILSGVITIGLFGLLFVNPVLAVVLMVPDLLINIYTELSGQRKVRQSILAVSSISDLVRGGREIAKVLPEDLKEERSELDALVLKFHSFLRLSVFVTSKGSISSGLGSVLLEYVNLFFHLDLIAYDSLIKDAKQYEEELFRITEIIGELDASIAVASFRQSLPTYCVPNFDDGGAKNRTLKAHQLYHPLLTHPVANSMTFESGILITGANASGKSTFLKSVALASVLAQSIATVPAKQYEAPFFRLYTSMALSDSLQQSESYFMAEIRSLKRIMDAIDGDSTCVLALIDEVLRGTNTIERIAASSRLLQECAVSDHALILAATHDIELTDMLQVAYSNYHFSGDIVEEDVRFDYTLKEGPTKTRNAIALLKQAGYPSYLSREAEEIAAHFETTGEWRRL